MKKPTVISALALSLFLTACAPARESDRLPGFPAGSPASEGTDNRNLPAPLKPPSVPPAGEPAPGPEDASPRARSAEPPIEHRAFVRENGEHRPVTPAPVSPECEERAIAILREKDPQGFAVTQDASGRKIFSSFLDCSRLVDSIPTAVHEGVHAQDLAHRTYFLADGSRLAMPPDRGLLMPPAEIARELDPQDMYVQTYLLGEASSKDSFTFLLEEFNAYARNLVTALALVGDRPRNRMTSDRDGVLAMMVMIRLYAQTAKERDRRSWDALKEPRFREPLRALWSQAETVLEQACAHPQLGLHDRKYLAVLDSGDPSALVAILGRPLRIPGACRTLMTR